MADRKASAMAMERRTAYEKLLSADSVQVDWLRSMAGKFGAFTAIRIRVGDFTYQRGEFDGE